MAQKYPKSLADAIKRIKGDAEVIKLLCGQKDDMQDERDKAISARRNEADARCSVQREIEKTREQFGDLKERLLTAEKEIARLTGYLERVREDDAVSDPLVEVEDQYGKRMVSKRHPAPIMNNGCSDFLHDQMMSREKRKHWTSY